MATKEKKPSVDPGTYYEDIRSDFNIALIKFGMQTKGHALAQKDFDPSINPSHINNVASGRSRNHDLRTRIEKFTNKHKG